MTNGGASSEKQRSADSAFGSGDLDEQFGSSASAVGGGGAPGCADRPPKAKKDVVSLCRFSGRFGYATLKLLPFTNREKVGWLRIDDARGFIRVYDPDANTKTSVVVPCKASTTVAEVAAKFAVDARTVFVQYNGCTIRRLSGDDRPLNIQNDYLKVIGFTDGQHMQSVGDSVLLGSLIRFFIGRPYSDDGFSGKPLMAECHVKRNRLFQTWTKRVCKLEGSNIFINSDKGEKESDNGGVTTISLARAKLEEAQVKGRGRCIHITTSHANSIYLAFDSMVDYNAWLCRCFSAAARIPPIGDLSNLQLEYLPDQLFRVGSERLITELNLKRNFLNEKPRREINSMSTGYLDDLAKLQSLRRLNLSDNDFKSFPKSLLKLASLTDLNLSKNSIEEIPAEINKLKNLQCLNMENNLVRWLPLELSDCDRLTQLELGFNLFTLMPETLVFLPGVRSWNLVGNNIRTVPAEFHAVKHVAKVNLRRNKLTEPFTFPQICWENIVELDLRDNFGIIEMDLRCLSSLRIVNCDRMGLVSLQLNGSNLTTLYANRNKLETITIMPVPHNLRILEASRNRLSKLPDWTADLKYVEKIACDHNYITTLPRRVFTNLNCLRFLMMNHNALCDLPQEIENCALEVLHLHHNRIRELPSGFLSSAHRLRVLNLAQNRLRSLPALNAFTDLNKVQHLTVTANFLDDSCLENILGYLRLKSLDLSYNRLTSLASGKWKQLTALETLNLSGNRITELPPALFSLPNLTTARAHSNCIKTAPDLLNAPKLQILDLSANALRFVDLNRLKTPELVQLDLTMNPDLRINDCNEPVYKNCKEKRAVSVTNVSSELQTHVERMRSTIEWTCGYSETSGERNKLCVYQVRQMKMSSSPSSLFAIVDGGHNADVAHQLRFDLPGLMMAGSAASANCNTPTAIAQQTPSVSPPDTPTRLRQTFLDAHCRLGDAGQRTGASCTVVVLETEGDEDRQRIVVANVGHTEALLCRRGHPITLTFDHSFGRGRDGHSAHQDEYDRIRFACGILTENNELNGATSCSRSIGNAFLYPAVIPDPAVSTYTLGLDDEFLIIANRSFWDVISKAEAVKRVRPISNPILAAKHLQDMATAYGQTENISVIVVRFLHHQPSPPLLGLSSGRGAQNDAGCSMPQPAATHYARSLTHLYLSDEDRLTDCDVKSEPPENVYSERPNYYFEYKKKLKEYFAAEEGDSDEEDVTGDDQTTPLASAIIVTNNRPASPQPAAAPVATTESAVQRTQLVSRLMTHSFHEEFQRQCSDQVGGLPEQELNRAPPELSGRRPMTRSLHDEFQRQCSDQVIVNSPPSQRSPHGLSGAERVGDRRRLMTRSLHDDVHRRRSGQVDSQQEPELNRSQHELSDVERVRDRQRFEEAKNEIFHNLRFRTPGIDRLLKAAASKSMH